MGSSASIRLSFWRLCLLFACAISALSLGACAGSQAAPQAAPSGDQLPEAETSAGGSSEAATPVASSEDGATELSSLEELHAACGRAETRAASHPTRGPELLVVTLEQLSFSPYDGSGTLAINTSQNLSLFGGSASLLPRELAPIEVVASEERASELVRETRAARLGLFLDFDAQGPDCLLRASAAVSVVRFDLAFVELLGTGGAVLAREDTSLLRTYRDMQGERGLQVSAFLAQRVQQRIAGCIGEDEALIVFIGRDGGWEMELSSASEEALACVLEALSDVPSDEGARAVIRYSP